MIEAHELFDVPYADIEVMVHPQSVIHSMVEFTDGCLAQASPPDMRLPIALGIGWPDRVPAPPRLSTGPLPTRGSSSRSTTRRSRLSRWPRRRGGRALPPGDLQRGERGAWPRSSRAGCRSSASSTPPAGAGGRSRIDEPGTVEDVLAAESWARAHAQEIIVGSVEGAR
ncbi:hypothetical protein V2I01_22900 [Micromonospora sp. BRA006-A]|nr:hypothetical protein [Micromonospora sp. BRA006-A]